MAFERELALSAEAQRAVRVMMRKSPETQRTYTGIYDRFAGWLAGREAVREVPVSAFTSEAFVSYLERLEERCSPSTVKKERAALRKLARYLHQLGMIDATVILMVEIPTVNELAPARRGLDRSSWEAVLTVARARLASSARARCSLQSAARDLALIQTLGGAGLRSHEARALPVDPFDTGRSDNHGGSVYLRVHGKGNKVRPVPLYSDVSDALERWRELRDEIPELAGDAYLFPQLGRRRRDGSFPDGGGQLSTTALIRIVGRSCLPQACRSSRLTRTRSDTPSAGFTWPRHEPSSRGFSGSWVTLLLRRQAATSTTMIMSSPPSTGGSSACDTIRSRADNSADAS